MRFWMTAVLSAVLTGCGNGDAGGAPSTDAGPQAAAPEVVVVVSGAHTGTFESTGAIFCTGGGQDEGFELYAMKIPEQLNLMLPRATAPGDYSMSGGSGAPFDFYYTDPQNVKYDRIESATIHMDSVPQAQGERLIGNISATLKSRDGKTVDVDIELDLDAGAQSFDECE